MPAVDLSSPITEGTVFWPPSLIAPPYCQWWGVWVGDLNESADSWLENGDGQLFVYPSRGIAVAYIKRNYKSPRPYPIYARCFDSDESVLVVPAFEDTAW